MKNFKHIILFLAITLLSFSTKAYTKEPAPQRINSDELKQTKITAYMQENITSGKNLLYCSTFQLAWNVLIDDIVKEPIRLKGNPLIAEMLNQRLTGKADIAENCYLAMAGYKSDNIEERVRQALKEKFNETPTIDISLEDPRDILAYAFLLKDLKFASEFESLEKPIFFKGSPVKAFGIKNYAFDKSHEKLGKQVSILDYKNDDDFIISLKSMQPEDEIILAKVLPQATLLETINSVSSRINSSHAPSLGEDETLRIPKLDFDLFHSYLELVDKKVLNKDFFKDKNYPPDAYYRIVKAIQSIRFRLNEKGAFLKSEAAIGMRYQAISMREPRQFIFDKPFLICLKQKGAKYPYFAMWVDNDELLLKDQAYSIKTLRAF